MPKRKRNQEITFGHIGKDIIKLIASFLDYYDRLYMSVVCKLFRVAKPLRAIIGGTLNPQEKDQKIYEIGVEIPKEQFETTLFEISIKDIIANDMQSYAQLYENIRLLRIYWKNDEGYNLDLNDILKGFQFIENLELVDFSTTTKTLFITIPEYCHPKWKYFTLFRGLGQDSILRKRIEVVLRRDMKEIGIYWPEEGYAQINCLDVGKCTNYKVDMIHGCSKIGVGKYSTKGNYYLRRTLFNKK